MEDNYAVKAEPQPEPAPPPEPLPPEPLPRERSLWSDALSLVVGLLGIAAIGASAWVYSHTQRDILRISTEIAQIRLSLELFNRQQGTDPATGATTPADSLTDLANRVAILEQSWRGNGTGAPAATSDLAGTTAPTDAGGDCMPTGTRFLVTAGDRYPICGTPAVLEVLSVANGYISLLDGTVIAAGGTSPLPGTQCMLGVVSAGTEDMSEFAEIRATC